MCGGGAGWCLWCCSTCSWLPTGMRQHATFMPGRHLTAEVRLRVCVHVIKSHESFFGAHPSGKSVCTHMHTLMCTYTQSGSLMNPCLSEGNKGWRHREERRSVKECRGEGGEEALPPLFGLEIDRLSLSPNLSISPSLLSLPPSISPWCRKVWRK